MPLHVSRTCAHHEEVKIALHRFLGFFVMWVVVLLFILLYYLNSLCLEHNTEDVDEALIAFRYIFIKFSLFLQWKCNVFSKLSKLEV